MKIPDNLSRSKRKQIHLNSARRTQSVKSQVNHYVEWVVRAINHFEIFEKSPTRRLYGDETVTRWPLVKSTRFIMKFPARRRLTRICRRRHVAAQLQQRRSLLCASTSDACHMMMSCRIRIRSISSSSNGDNGRRFELRQRCRLPWHVNVWHSSHVRQLTID